jgi:hypothetical protein
MYRVDEGERKAERVGERYQDTMGFTIVGPNRFLGSGHPDVNEAREKNLPSLLGLIESTDSGRAGSRSRCSARRTSTFSASRASASTVTTPRTTGFVSRDRGRTWKELEKPGPLVDLAVDPTNARRIVATSAGGLEEGLLSRATAVRAGGG